MVLRDFSCFPDCAGVRRTHISGAGGGALGFGEFADEEAEGAVGGFGEAYAWGDLDFGGVVAVVGDLDGGVG